VRQLWGAYTYLRDHDLSSISGTSRLLHEATTPYLCGRLAAELEELAGVVEGTHRHTGQRQDLVLEASQVCYWVCLLALRQELTYEQLDPAAQLSWAVSETIPAQVEITQRLWGAAAGLAGASGDVSALREALALLSVACCAYQVDVQEIADYDLNQMLARPYLVAYFSGSSGSG
jgi:hypothetical protein